MTTTASFRTTSHAVDAGAAIRPYDLQFKAIASTAAVDARDNTQTRPSDTDAPIYWLNGNKAADNYADMYDGDLGRRGEPNDRVRHQDHHHRPRPRGLDRQ